MFSTCSKEHEAVFSAKNDKEMIMQKAKTQLPLVKNVHFFEGVRAKEILNAYATAGCYNKLAEYLCNRGLQVASTS